MTSGINNLPEATPNPTVRKVNRSARSNYQNQVLDILRSIEGTLGMEFNATVTHGIKQTDSLHSRLSRMEESEIIRSAHAVKSMHWGFFTLAVLIVVQAVELAILLMR